MTSGKQKRTHLKTARKIKAEKRAKGFAESVERHAPRVAPPGEALVNVSALRGSSSWGDPDFVRRGTYRDLKFTCAGCGKTETWTATQQKWWYEIAKGDVQTTATRCRPCRAKERARKVEARRVHLEGIERKKQMRPPR